MTTLSNSEESPSWHRTLLGIDANYPIVFNGIGFLTVREALDECVDPVEVWLCACLQYPAIKFTFLQTQGPLIKKYGHQVQRDYVLEIVRNYLKNGADPFEKYFREKVYTFIINKCQKVSKEVEELHKKKKLQNVKVR
jgi:hypothetical protein